MSLNYQLFIGGPAISCKNSIVNKIRNTFAEIGLDVDSDLTLYGADNHKQINYKGNPVGLWLGNQDQADNIEVDALKCLVEKDVPFLPVVSDLNKYRDEVPESLYHINGIQADNEESIISTLLAMFHLTPHDRRIFISYCRKESQGVANQLFNTLSEKGFSVFLDVISVGHGTVFQEVLLDHLNDFDLVVLLDTPGIDSSYWVQEEIINAHHMGLGFFQLIWPNKKSHPISNLNTKHELFLDNFLERKTESDSQLHQPIVQDIVRKIMATRIRSIGARRQRIVNDFLALVETFSTSSNIEYYITLKQEIWIKKGSKKICWVWPSTRQPTSLLIHQKLEAPKTPPMKFADTPRDESNDRILFDDLGIHNDHRFHLDWLRKHLPFKTISLEAVNDWLHNEFRS